MATMTDDFEDHCWKDVIPADVLELYSFYKRKIFVGPSPALLAIDLYEVVYAGGAKPPATVKVTPANRAAGWCRERCCPS